MEKKIQQGGEEASFHFLKVSTRALEEVKIYRFTELDLEIFLIFVLNHYQ